MLAERGLLSPSDRREVERLVERHLKSHGGNAAASLAAAIDENARAALSTVDDAEVRRSLDGLPEDDGRVVVPTQAYVPEMRERYALTSLHAKGGIGQIWLARDGDLGREVALKELRPERSNDPLIWRRFVAEAQITGQLEHPSIVPVYELVKPTGNRPAFYTMRYVRGRTLSRAVRVYHKRRAKGQSQPLDQHSLLNAFVNVCNAVAYAHSRGVIHRDLKPDNVILGDFGEAVVLDWGLAKVMGGSSAEDGAPPVAVERVGDRQATIEGQILGTRRTWRRSRPAADSIRSACARTFTDWALFCTRSSRANRRFRATTLRSCCRKSARRSRSGRVK
jgi:serine/threonine protein kinase